MFYGEGKGLKNDVSRMVHQSFLFSLQISATNVAYKVNEKAQTQIGRVSS